MRVGRQSKFKAALPELIGFYVVTAMLTGVSVYQQLPQGRVDQNRRIEWAMTSGSLWPIYWTLRGFRAVAQSTGALT